MFGGTEKAGEIQRVERPSSQEEKIGAATVWQNQHTRNENWCSDKKENFSVWSKTTCTKLGKCTRLKIKNLIQK
jgi:hypothetical protein